MDAGADEEIRLQDDALVVERGGAAGVAVVGVDARLRAHLHHAFRPGRSLPKAIPGFAKAGSAFRCAELLRRKDVSGFG